MRLVIDANILFAALIKDGFTRKLLMERGEILYAPDYLMDEFSRKSSELEEKTGMPKEVLLRKLTEFIEISDMIIIGEVELKEFIEEAKRINPDPKDVPYFALALKLNCPIWSADKRLKKQDKVRIIDTKEMIE